MAGDYFQSVALITIFIGVASTVLSRFLQVILNSRGWMNSWMVFGVAVVGWVVFFAVYQYVVSVLDIFEAKRPNWIRYLKRAGSITNIVIGVFLSFYLAGLIETVNFQSFGFAEVFLLMVAAILLLAAIQLMFERYAVVGDVRSNLSNTEGGAPPHDQKSKI